MSATAEAVISEVAPAKTTAQTEGYTEPNLGDVYSQELAKLQGKEAPAKAAAEPAPEKTEAAPEPEKTEAAKPADDPLDLVTKEPEKKEPEADPLAEFADEKSRNWKRAREVMGSQAKLIADLNRAKTDYEAKLAEVPKADPQAAQRIAELEEKLNGYKDSIVAVNIELDPDFRKEFVDGRVDLVNRAGAKLAAYGGDPKALADALSYPEGKKRDTAIREAFGENVDDPIAQGKILGIVAEIERLDEKKADALRNAQPAYENLQRKRQAESAQQQQAAEDFKAAVFEKVSKGIAAVSPLFKTIDGNEEWNAPIQKAIEDAKGLLSADAKPEDIVMAAIRDRYFPILEKRVFDQHGEIKKLKAQLAEFDASEPDVKGRGKTKAADPLDTDPGSLYMQTLSKLTGGGDD